MWRDDLGSKFGGRGPTTPRMAPPHTKLRASSDEDASAGRPRSGRKRIRESVSSGLRKKVSPAFKKVQKLVGSKSSAVASAVTGAPIAGVLTDAAANAAEMAATEVLRNMQSASEAESQARIEAGAAEALDTISLAKTNVADAFDAAEAALLAAEGEIARARGELAAARREAALGLAAAESAAAGAARAAEKATEAAIESALAAEEGAKEGIDMERWPEASLGRRKEDDKRSEATEERGTEKADEDDAADPFSNGLPDLDVASLDYEDVDYTLTEMAPPFIGEDECLVPGEPVVRVEKAPQNSRRIFAGIDIPVSVEEVWDLLTDYPNLQRVVPNLVVNEVLKLYDGVSGTPTLPSGDLSDADQCRAFAEQMRGSVLRQVGGAKVVGINFSARTTLEVREWPHGMPDFAHFTNEIYEGKTRADRARDSRKRELERYIFPRPFALSSLPVRDISMQSVEGDDGEFRMYQGVWRMQPLPGCAPKGGSAMRLTYAVEVSPRPYLPVALVEGRIAQDLCSNLKAIRALFDT